MTGGNGEPSRMLAQFGYVKKRIHAKPGIRAEHGTFIFKGRKYFVEFVKVESEFDNPEQTNRWVVSKVSVLESNSKVAPELVYHFKEERMVDQNRKRNAFLLVINDNPILAVCNCESLIKVYELEDLVKGIGLKFGGEFLRFRPKSYKEVMDLKFVCSCVLNKKYVTLPHEENNDRYEFFCNFYAENFPENYSI